MEPGAAGDLLSPLRRPGPLRHQVQDALVELIISRRLAPGQHLVEVDIARQLQVSRQPVREALQSLQGDGWIELRPGRGAYVHEPTVSEVDEVFAVRVMLEQQSARLAARHARPDSVARLRAICADGRTALAADDADTIVAANAALHRAVTALAGNRVLQRFTANLDRRVRWYFTPIVRNRGAASWDEHDELIAALERGDEDHAAQVMHDHTEMSRVTYRRLHAGQLDSADR